MAVGQAPSRKTSAPAPEAAPQAAAPEFVAQPTQSASSSGKRATPAARKAARDNKVSLAEVIGTGPLGRVQLADMQGQIAMRTAPRVTDTLASPGWASEPGALHITRRSGTGKSVVLLHGFTSDSQSWAPLEKALGPNTALLRIDLPGHGKSPKRQVNSFQDLSRMVVEAFDDATRGSDGVHLVGHSLGAALALALADIRGRRITSLTLIAPAGLGPEIDAAALNGIVRASRVESLTPWLRRLTAMPDGISDDYARAAMRARADGALRACQADMAQALFPDGVQAFDLRPALKRADVPLQIVWGRSDHIVPAAHAVQADGEFALHLLSGAGHIPQIECPERVARIIHQMIRSVEPVGR
jgi:pyruvate dehydrogenase E2 component (dihydrolipoamide acetyltransferase)